MPEDEKTYTYRGGRRLELGKRPDQAVVRTSPERIADPSVFRTERVSSGSVRITTHPSELEAVMERARDIAPTHHAYYDLETGEEFLITDRVLVTFKGTPSPAEVDAFAARYGLVQLERYTDRDFLFQLTNHTGMNPVKLVVKLMEEEPMVELAEHDLNQRMSKYAFTPPSDPAYARQWHLHTRFTDPEFDPRASSRCEEAWSLLGHFGSPDVVVAVTDDGCRLDHPDFDLPDKFAGWGYLRGTRLVTSEDFDADPEEMWSPGANHGTSCAGVIAGAVNAVLTVGAAPDCRLLPIQWESNGPYLLISDSKLLTVLDYLADRADIVSNSWGSVPRNLWASQVTRRIEELARSGGRRGKGILFLWAAGNENCPIEHEADVDVPYTHGWEQRPDGSWEWVGVETTRRFVNNLVGMEGVLHVAALASTARRSHYSNYGTGIALCAPTNNVHTYYRLSVAGLGITTTTGGGAQVTETFGGTSSATPLTAGVAALVISANPALSASEIAALLKRTASKDLDFSGYPRTPPAVYDPNPDWDVSPIAPFDDGAFRDIGAEEGSWSPWFGHGRVDAYAAVAAALAQVPRTGARQWKAEQVPDLDIPDADTTGVESVLECPEEFVLSDIAVEVDIAHSFIGDLEVALVSPAGTTAVLHDRSGGAQSGLLATFEPSTSPQLARILGEEARGPWRLRVRDLAAEDTGRLHRWALRLRGVEKRRVVLEEAPALAIPDAPGPAVERTLTAEAEGTLETLRVEVDITHTYIGDLEVTLQSPAGTTVTLHSRSGAWQDNIVRSYTADDTPALAALHGEPVRGDWRLRIIDRAPRDRGKLNRWGLVLDLV